MFYVYIIYSESIDRYYIGQTNNLAERLTRHNLGYENYTSKGKPWELKWYAEKSSRQTSMELEKKLKNLSRKRLENFIL